MVGTLFGQFIKPDIGSIVNVVHFLYLSFVAFSEVEQFHHQCVETDYYGHIQKNIRMIKCGHKDDAEKGATNQQYDERHYERYHSE